MMMEQVVNINDVHEKGCIQTWAYRKKNCLSTSTAYTENTFKDDKKHHQITPKPTVITQQRDDQTMKNINYNKIRLGT